MWKTIAVFENYEVSEKGEIRNKTTAKQKKLTTKDGCSYVTLFTPEQARTIPVHSIVLETFKGKPFGAKKIRHKNGNKKDNRLDNLEWDMVEYELPEKVLRMVKEAIAKGLMTQKEASELYDIPQENLQKQLS